MKSTVVGQGLCSSISTDGGVLYPATPVANLTTVGTPPFSIH
jgi:hypothetical protein